MSDIAYTDVLIAGAGLAGASLALALSRDDMCFPSYRQQGILIARD